MPVVNTKGAASSQGFGEFAKSGAAAYIEDVFSTYLYTGTSATRTITNGIDLSTKGGLVWIKQRNQAINNVLQDTAGTGTSNYLVSNTTAAMTSTGGVNLTAFNTTGFTLGTAPQINESGYPLVSWTFRKQPKFFDVVTYTGNGANRTISHSLGAVPGCIIIKQLDTTSNWRVYHRSLISTAYSAQLNLTAQQVSDATVWNNTAPTSTVFSLGTSTEVNTSGGTYVAYIFAHNAGGFGVSGTDNVISCGSYTGNGSSTGPIVTLGYEPQWLLIKNSTSPDDWMMFDNMRGLSVGVNDYAFNANGTTSEIGPNDKVDPTATGFTLTTPSGSVNTSGDTFIYIAIRRGPMRTPTTGTSVFYPLTQTGNADNTSVGFPPDWTPFRIRNGAGNWAGYDRLRGLNQNLQFNTTSAESSVATIIDGWFMNGINFGSGIGGTDQVYVPCFKRAPGFFDVVCYTGTGANATQSHNLGVVPELMIVKKRSAAANWAVYHSSLTAAGYALLNTTAASTTASTFWQSTTPTAANFYIGTNGNVGDVGATYVAYLFATCPGVSKVFSYTGNGTSQTINCGFTGGARFILIKRTDTTGDWYIWDTARGIVAGTDPHLSLNTTVAEVTTDDSIDPDSTGFIVNQLAATDINVSAATYIGLAIA